VGYEQATACMVSGRKLFVFRARDPDPVLGHTDHGFAAARVGIPLSGRKCV
jgi:hypothetical protein